MSVKNLYRVFLFALLCLACTKPQSYFKEINGFVVEAAIDGKVAKNNTNVTDVNIDDVVIDLKFSSEIDKSKVNLSSFMLSGIFKALEIVENSDPYTVSLKITGLLYLIKSNTRGLVIRFMSRIRSFSCFSMPNTYISTSASSIKRAISVAIAAPMTP